jgi:beta-phosphoglucomutase-like phosphatase (HAD superfamily)
MIRALIFDFDGLIVDTESPAFDAWQKLYRDHGLQLAPEVWAQVIGTHEHRFDAMDHLESLHGAPLERKSLNARRVEHKLQMTGAQPLLPGVVELVQFATERGISLGVASSSSHQWVEENLERRGLLAAFDCIRFEAGEAVVFEDSPNGIASAQAAGIFAVAVPNPMTASLNLDAADMRLDSLAALSPDQLLAALESRLTTP